MLPEPDQALIHLGVFIRAAREARGIPQLRAAREAGVSRRQLRLLEDGGNVSLKFLLKIAHYLQLREVPVDGTLKLVSGNVGLRIVELLRALEAIDAIFDRVRLLALDAVLPVGERPALTHTAAVDAFLTRHRDDAGTGSLIAAVLQASEDAPAKVRPPRVGEAEERSVQRARATKKRRG